MMPAPRTRLGRFAGAASRYSVFRTEAAIEIDQMDHFEVTRKRVFFDDILLVTHHRELGTLFFIVNAFIAVIFGTLALVFIISSEPPAAITFGCLAAPSTLALIIRLILRVDVVTIFGRRSRAVLRYTFRKRFARETFADLCERARAAQQKVADEIAASMPIAIPVDAPPLPPPAVEGGVVLPPQAAAEELPPMPPAQTTGEVLPPQAPSEEAPRSPASTESPISTAPPESPESTALRDQG